MELLADTTFLIGPNDLWIAACALANRLPVLTRNVSQFRRVDGLEVIDYAAGDAGTHPAKG
jgi:predicted nucleic acid-binding protein